MKHLRFLFIMILVIHVTHFSYGQAKSKINKTDSVTVPSNILVGTWRLIEFADIDTLTGKWGNRYGKNPRGYFTYTKTNIVNLNISTDAPLKISEDSAKNYSINYLNLTNNYSLGYFGTYTIDWERSIVIHHVKGGSLPWYIDTDQPRPFKLNGDTLIIGDNKTWKRVLVRAD